MVRRRMPKDINQQVEFWWKLGKIDREIAEYTGINKTTVGRLRNKMGLRANGQGGNSLKKPPRRKVEDPKPVIVGTRKEGNVEVIICSKGYARGLLRWVKENIW
jgi:hypothetical protein